MFDKIKFSEILTKIKELYDSQEEFAKYSGVGRTYISQYMNCKIDYPPKPQLIEKIAKASKGVTTYDELMSICGYINKINNSLTESSYFVQIPLFLNLQEFLIYNLDKRIENSPHNYYVSLNLKENPLDYFAFKAFDNSMIPLLDVGDIAIIHQQNFIEDKQTHLILLDDNELLIRKIIDMKNNIQLIASNTSIDDSIINMTIAEMKEHNFTILGKVVKAINQSAFK